MLEWVKLILKAMSDWWSRTLLCICESCSVLNFSRKQTCEVVFFKIYMSLVMAVLLFLHGDTRAHMTWRECNFCSGSRNFIITGPMIHHLRFSLSLMSSLSAAVNIEYTIVYW